MKRIPIAAFLLCAFLLGTRPARAQLKGFSLGPYIEVARPAGDFSAAHKNGIGAGLGADIKIGNHLSATGSYGIVHFGARGSEAAAVNALPLRLGLKYRLPLVYLKLESGSATFTRNGGSAFLLSPGVGLRLLGLDVQASYETWLRDKNIRFASLKLGYHF